MADKVRILAGSCVRQDPTVLDYHLRSLRALRIPKNVEVDYAFVDDNDAEESRALLVHHGANIIPAEPRPPQDGYSIGTTHNWNVEIILHVGRNKQRLLDLARDEGYDYFFLVDSDLLLDPGTLESLLSIKGEIVSAVYWTQWTPESEPLPQVWLRNPYELEGFGVPKHQFIRSLVARDVVHVMGGGACCLYSTDVLDRARFFPPHPWQPMDGGNMWAGEDRTMSLSAQHGRVRQWADAWPNIFHAYHHQHRTKERLEDIFTRLQAPRQRQAKYGDLISFTVDSLEIPSLQNVGPDVRCVRGRLGGLDLLPEVEAALLDMEVGEERMMEIHYPYWNPLKDLAGKQRFIMLKLLDVKPYGFHPMLAEYAMKGIV